MNIISLEEATYMRDLFAAFVTAKPMAREILTLLNDNEPYSFHGKGIAIALGYELGSIQRSIARMVEGGLITTKKGIGRKHLANYYAVVPSKVEELAVVYEQFKPAK